MSAKNIAHNTVGPGGAPLTRHPVRTAQLLWGDERQLRAALGGGSGTPAGSSSSGGGSSSSTGAGATSGPGLAAAAAEAAHAGAALAITDAGGGSRAPPTPTADVILMSDVVYGSDPGLWEKLVATLAAASAPDTLLVQAETKRVEGGLVSSRTQYCT